MVLRISAKAHASSLTHYMSLTDNSIAPCSYKVTIDPAVEYRIQYLTNQTAQ